MARRKEQAEAAQIRRHGGMETVIDAYQAPLLRYAARLLNNATLAQDVVQNALIKLFRQWQPGQQPGAHLRNWLYRVVHNEAVDVIRAEERRKRLHGEHAVALDLVETGGSQTDPPPDEREALVLRCLGVLDPAQRQVVLLRLQQGMSYEEIATVTGLSSGYVGNLLHFAVKRLAVEVKRQEGVAP
jgi:RNA polymerase sigma factor (sigma-70 family)